ncbi:MULTISPECIES: glycogen/starch synthase [Porphyromonadaceae]|uniref:starch synthase n=1 Tax=Sanguibacteroides justesenii TaxID=1547597 RepID=A0AB34R3S5_9PORP|nr:MULTISPECIES: glycogen/starch synthase [Porphyromonadaceae]KIO46256.1 glycogen synthase [Sanguibacteroides justesenii]MCR9010739.1 glycogen/starch synthase [Gabonibacter chumensis]PXZ44317.1 glycogen synthase [Sanguibacteroides justesenii]
MAKKRVLFISQEIVPYLPESEMANIGRYLPQGIQDKGKEIRTFMPRYGCINERRNQLHEVIRLSGMNLIINDTDHPLIIKVASIQAARMQVYFIDNDDYFQRKHVITDSEGNFFDDNDERAIFFARGVFETVRKLRWAPDLIYCQGWLTSLVPLYLKKEYHDDPVFSKAKVVFSTYNDKFEGSLNHKFAEKAITEGVFPKDLTLVKEPTHTNINKLAFQYSDGIIFNQPDIEDELKRFAEASGKPILEYPGEESYVDQYSDFFDKIIG